MKTSIEKKRAKALELMKQLDLCEDFVEMFKEKGIVTYFEQHIGYWAFQDEELMAKIKAFEEKWNALVFAVTHEYCEFGECYSFLYIPDQRDEWDDMVQRTDERNVFYAFAYVWNKDYDYDSEFGSILVKTRFGGLRRVA